MSQVVRRYEMLLLLDVSQSEEIVEKIITKLQEMIEASEGSELLTLDRWGKKRLAYEIRKKQFGYYALYEFTASADLPSELDRFCRLETGVMRHLILHIPEHILRLKEKEKKIKAAMLARREAAREDSETVVEDLLGDRIESAVGAPREEGEIPVKQEAPVQEKTDDAAEKDEADKENVQN